METIELDYLDSVIIMVISEAKTASIENIWARVIEETNKKYGKTVVLLRLIKLVETGCVNITQGKKENFFYYTINKT